MTINTKVLKGLMKFVIRADASLQIGSGHIMRCLTLADTLRQQGHDVTFICREHDGHLADFIQQKGFDVQLLAKSDTIEFAKNFKKNYAHSEWLGKSEQDDFGECQPILDKLQPNWLIIDHYAIGKTWEVLAKSLCPNVKILAIDDLADREHDCEILLDQTFGRKAEDYQNLVPENCHLLLGTHYALLREEFSQWREISLNRRKNLTQPKTILVNLGGVDKDNITLRILQSLNTFISKATQVTVVMGKTAPHIASVQAFANQMANCQVIVNASNMAELMANADLAIGAAGSTTWERCCLGLPTIHIVLAENQKAASYNLKQHKLGQFLSIGEIDNELPKVLDLYFNRYSLVQDIISRSMQVVDGRGVDRVCKILLEK